MAIDYSKVPDLFEARTVIHGVKSIHDDPATLYLSRTQALKRCHFEAKGLTKISTYRSEVIEIENGYAVVVKKTGEQLALCIVVQAIIL